VLNSQFANALSGSTAAVRIIFSMGREGVISRVLGRTNTHDSPGVAWTAYIMFSALVTYGAGAAIGPLGVYAWLGSFLGLGIIIIYIMMNVGLASYFWRRHRDEFNWFRHGVLPALGSVLMLLPIYGLLWPVPPWPYSLVPYLLVAWVIAGVGYFAVVRSRKPQVVAAMGRVWEGSPPQSGEHVSASSVPNASLSADDSTMQI
jgi:amino acid transporter